ncbi:MAG: ABC transporter ATP-binding protein [Proteobacteria bacterium]|nr:ABC transporter ATP-binding protein [Pseudomonadota bacterium]
MSLMSIDNLRVRFPSAAGTVFAVNGVSLSIEPGEILGIVGESGSGKSVTCQSLMGLLGPRARASGRVTYDGRSVEIGEIVALRRAGGFPAAMIFQDAVAGLNPIRTVGSQIAEVFRYGRGLSPAEAGRRTVAGLAAVGIRDPEQRVKAYPHQLSGGMNQRVTIAMALAAEPRLLIADEPTTALDVTVQAQICALLRRLVDETGVSVIFISHDLDLVTEFCDRVAVMYAGAVAEVGTSRQLKEAPRHPYTRALFAAIPGHRPAFSTLEEIPGEIAIQGAEPTACGFAPRCARVTDLCRREIPPLMAEGAGRLACFNPH